MDGGEPDIPVYKYVSKKEKQINASFWQVCEHQVKLQSYKQRYTAVLDVTW